MTERRSPFGRSAVPRNRRDLYTVQLECGDQITSRNPPLNNRTTYVCQAAKGHGYRVRWVSYISGSMGFARDNPDIDVTGEGETA